MPLRWGFAGDVAADSEDHENSNDNNNNNN